MKDRLRVGVVGLGVGIHHVDALIQRQECPEIRIWDLDENKIREVMHQYPTVIPCDREEQIIGNREVDLAVICSYDDAHSKQIVPAIRAGQHVFSEKPLCLHRTEMRQIQSALIERPSVKLSSNFVLRTNPRFQYFKKKIELGDLGDIYLIEGDYYWGRREKFYGWRAEMDFYSIILGAAIHMIDMVVWLVGELPVEVQVMGNDLATRDAPIKYNSLAVLLFRFPGGMIAKITGNGGCVYPHFHGLEIFGTRNTLIHELNGSYCIGPGDSDYEIAPIKEPYPSKELRCDVIVSFVKSIMDESSPPIVTEEDVFNVMSICFSAEESMQSGATVRITYQ